ncbi:MAG: hypothetical protein K0M49_16440, partial [Arenimonas sp.]|nr:hypothetical protein [Arenimonas sp.]
PVCWQTRTLARRHPRPCRGSREVDEINRTQMLGVKPEHDERTLGKLRQNSEGRRAARPSTGRNCPGLINRDLINTE